MLDGIVSIQNPDNEDPKNLMTDEEMDALLSRWYDNLRQGEQRLSREAFFDREGVTSKLNRNYFHEVLGG